MSIGRRKPQDLNEDQLIELALASKKPIEMGKMTEAAKFIYDKQIRPGDAKISAALIYYTYKLWKGLTGQKQPKSMFFRDFGTIFDPQKDSDGTRFYYLDPNSFDLSEDMYWEMRADVRRDKNRAFNKRNNYGKKNNPT